MKISGLLAPLLVTSLIFLSVWCIGMLTVRSSAMATQSSIELLRMQIEVARLQQHLQQHSQPEQISHDVAVIGEKVKEDLARRTAATDR